MDKMRQRGAHALGSGWESLEERVVMSAAPAAVPDFVVSSSPATSNELTLQATPADPHAQTGLDRVRADYGFTGVGQTVVVIDTGIAWDHVALGGGYGEDFRVVGGWDFSEGDADPYDDGWMGSHGTHVSGIIGADDAQHTGVAPGVDIVALRVFNDDGEGYFEWVESALAWVHDHRLDFENPITTVNLSLGVDWNADSLPQWATLEDELAQLESDGIFIAVAAGNNFRSYGTTGLSYPAVSEYVVPVMSVDADGQLSYFSQRDRRAIAAPGSWITSTVPDYVGNFNNRTDDYAAYSGTSMASPYIAGASVLLREAMTFVGTTGITQDDIYQIMCDTARSVYDAATGLSYLQLDLDAAIDAIMPDDDYGSTLTTAHQIGPLGGTMTMAGLIGTMSDVDYFTFTADATGTARFSSEFSCGAAANWQLGNSGGAVDEQGNLVFGVVRGQTYTVGVASTGGLSYYTLDVAVESSFTFVDWGTVEFASLADQANSGETWYRVAAGRDGYLTVEAFFSAARGNVDLELYDTSMNLVDASNGSGGGERVDVVASSGEEFFIKVIGNNADVDFRLANLVSLSGSTVTVHGTSGDDALEFRAGRTADGTDHEITINGVAYRFSPSAVKNVKFDGGAGRDSTTLVGTAGDERLFAYPNSLRFVGADFSLAADQIESSVTRGNGGYDLAYLYDSAGDDRLTATPEFARLEAVDGSFGNLASGFDRVNAYASAGYDFARLEDSAGDDRFKTTPEYAVLYAADRAYFNYAKGFDRVNAYASEGYDVANLYDSAGDDYFRATPEFAVLYAADREYLNYAKGFARVNAYASEGNDRAKLEDSAGDDYFRATPGFAVLRGLSGAFLNYAAGFDRVDACATGGYDRAKLEDSAGDDALIAAVWGVCIAGDEYRNEARGFDEIIARLTTNNDESEVQAIDYVFGLVDY